MALSKIDPAGLDIGQIGGRRNLIINGAMQVAQRGTSTSVGTDSSGYSPDRFRLGTAGTTAADIKQVTTVPSGSGFGKSLQIDVTTDDSTLAAGDAILLNYKFEGQDLQGLKKGSSSAEALTLSFWVRSPKTGTHIAELYDSDNTRHLSKSYTISTADTWEHKTITYAGDTTGTFDNDNNSSMTLNFWLGAGTTYSSGTLQSSWGTPTNANRAAGQVNVFDSASNNFYITGVQLEVGDTATPFEHRSYGEELALCHRYFQKYLGTNAYEALPSYVIAGNSTASEGFISYKATMRSNPSLSTSTICLLDAVAVFSISASSILHNGLDSCRIKYTSSGLTSYRSYYVTANNSTSAYLTLDAEL
jgi:hypothetical protein